MLNKVAAIIVTYNPDVSILKLALEASIQQVSFIYLVDNNSSNYNDVEKVASSVNNIELIRLNDNLGLAKAQNIALQKAKDDGQVNYVILFDQDSIIEEGFISALLIDDAELRVKGHNVGAIGPVYYDPSSGEIYPATIYVGPFIKRVAILNSPLQSTFLIASGCLIRIDILNEIGLMKEELFIDYIDVEWSLRARSKGYELFISPNAKMQHTIGDARVRIFGRSISVHNPIRRYYLIRNSFLMIKLSYIPVGYKLREFVFNIIRFGVGLTISNDRKRFLRFAMQGVKDGVSGKFGPCRMKIK